MKPIRSLEKLSRIVTWINTGLKAKVLNCLYELAKLKPKDKDNRWASLVEFMFGLEKEINTFLIHISEFQTSPRTELD